MKIFDLIRFLVVINAFSINAQSADGFIPRIERPLQDSKGLHSITFGISGEKRLHHDTLSMRLSPRFSYSVNDNVTFCDLPWPLIQLRIKPSIVNTTIKNGWDAVALSICFGTVSTLGFSELSFERLHGYVDDYVRIMPRIELLSKINLSNRLWAQYNMLISSVSDEALQGSIFPRIGCQFTNWFYGVVGYRGGFFLFDKTIPENSRISYFYRYGYSLDYFHSSNNELPIAKQKSHASSFPIEIGFDIGRHYSTVLSTSITKNIGKFVPAQVQCCIEW
jgi:hypothetical protein